MYLAQRPEMLNPRVAHDDVDPAELTLDHLEQGGYVGLGGDVSLDGDYADVVVADLACEGVGGGPFGLVALRYAAEPASAPPRQPKPAARLPLSIGVELWL